MWREAEETGGLVFMQSANSEMPFLCTFIIPSIALRATAAKCASFARQISSDAKPNVA